MRAVNHGMPRGRLSTGRALDRAPNVSIRSVACPDCPAQVGERCDTARPQGHAARRRMAIRALNTAREAEQEATR